MVKEKEKIEIIDDIKEKKGKGSIIFLTISIVILVISVGITGYLLFKNNSLKKEVNDLNTNITKVQEKISTDKIEINEKENEYEKLKETLKEQFEELSIWEETKEKLNKALS